MKHLLFRNTVHPIPIVHFASFFSRSNYNFAIINNLHLPFLITSHDCNLFPVRSQNQCCLFQLNIKNKKENSEKQKLHMKEMCKLSNKHSVTFIDILEQALVGWLLLIEFDVLCVAANG